MTLARHIAFVGNELRYVRRFIGEARFLKRVHSKAVRRVDAVGEDLAANDAYLPTDVNEHDECCGVCPWFGPCPHCDLPPVIEDAAPARAPLRAPLAEIARAA